MITFRIIITGVASSSYNMRSCWSSVPKSCWWFVDVVAVTRGFGGSAVGRRYSPSVFFTLVKGLEQFRGAVFQAFHEDFLAIVGLFVSEKVCIDDFSSRLFCTIVGFVFGLTRGLIGLTILRSSSKIWHIFLNYAIF